MNKPHLPTVTKDRYRITENKFKSGLYFAYGSNLCLNQMLGSRCPKARPICRARLENWKLVFRGCADIERAEGESVVGAVFRITPECEMALDRYEGYPTMYTKATSKIVLDSNDGPKTRTMMFYVMTQQNYQSGPSEGYFDTILKGYADFQMPDADFDALVAATEKADADEQEFRARFPHMKRDRRGRYFEPKYTQPFIAARELQKSVIEPFNQRDMDVLDRFDSWTDTNRETYLNDLIGTLSDEE